MENYKIYLHKNKLNNKVYVGLTKLEPKERWRLDYYAYFKKALEKYGWENFESVILEDGLTLEQANIQEKYYIEKYQSNNPKFGYNCTSGGDHHWEFTAEVRKVMSERSPRRKWTEEQRRRLSEKRKGIIFSEEHLRNLSISHKGKIHSEEYKEKMRKNSPCAIQVFCVETQQIFDSYYHAAKCLFNNEKCAEYISLCARNKIEKYRGFHFRKVNKEE